ncbi:Protein of unknown function [Geodermatophilus pulveris]|uniref:Uncharacterized protein n=1 Tax=Geodermatophilus pulveris TaxID=1564159 RepID=A0A239HBV4_9ACTN|nr:DUF3237 domain-containing protein [Geodermatophilus pulveris]SNS78879.1 Protein of unknown function [Geodermatophilus pulveris]
MTIELVPLCTMHITVRPPLEVGTGPTGTRLLFEQESVKFEGERFSGELAGAASGDWLLVGPEGTATLDVRATVRTHDGALVLCQYHGRMDVSDGMDLPKTIYAAPRFETGDERYAWLNRVQAVGKGIVHEDLTIDYEWYEVR